MLMSNCCSLFWHPQFARRSARAFHFLFTLDDMVYATFFNCWLIYVVTHVVRQILLNFSAGAPCWSCLIVSIVILKSPSIYRLWYPSLTAIANPLFSAWNSALLLVAIPQSIA